MNETVDGRKWEVTGETAEQLIVAGVIVGEVRQLGGSWMVRLFIKGPGPCAIRPDKDEAKKALEQVFEQYMKEQDAERQAAAR